MSQKVRSVVVRLVVACMVTFGTSVATAPTAMASYDCYWGSAGYWVGSFYPWHAYAICYQGSGWYYVKAQCYMGPGWYIYPTGPKRYVGQGDSRVACPDNDKPTYVWIVKGG